MGVDHRGLRPGMTQHFLDVPNVCSILQHMRGKGMP